MMAHGSRASFDSHDQQQHIQYSTLVEYPQLHSQGAAILSANSSEMMASGTTNSLAMPGQQQRIQHVATAEHPQRQSAASQRIVGATPYDPIGSPNSDHRPSETESASGESQSVKLLRAELGLLRAELSTLKRLMINGVHRCTPEAKCSYGTIA